MKTHLVTVTEAICRTPITKKVSHNPSQNEEQIRKMTNLGIALVSGYVSYRSRTLLCVKKVSERVKEVLIRKRKKAK